METDLLHTPLPRLNLEKMCRVCLRSDSELELLLLFDEKYAEQGAVAATMLTQCTKYKVERCDELPQLICGTCLDAARNAYRFKQICEQSYQTLRNILLSRPNSLNKASAIKVETDAYAEKSTQTDDCTLYPCERCDQKYLTFDALKAHRETQHKGSAIVCRYCAKSFNRIGYLKAHYAIFHPESGYTSHNQCRICRRQFTRREHMRRHLAVIHKIVEIVDEQEQDVEEKDLAAEDEEESKSAGDNETQFADIDHSELPDSTEVPGLQPVGKDNDANHVLGTQIQQLLPTEQKFFNYQSESEGDEDANYNANDVSPVIPMTSDDEDDEKPLSNFVNSSTTKGFIEVLLNENSADIKAENADRKRVKLEHTASPPAHESSQEDDNDAEEDVLQPAVVVKRGRGRPRRIHKAKQSPTSTSGEENSGEHKCSDRATLQRHQLNYTKKRKFVCNICPKGFSRADFLKNHMNSVHDASRHMKCNECELEFTLISQYKRHKEIKHGGRVHKCEVCAKCFTTKIYLQRHMLSHGKKRYVCKECAQSFISKEELAAHIKAEGHDKPMLCPECGLRCKTSNILMVHMRRHNGEKPFKCKFCSKGFPRMDDLRVHEKYHTGEKSHFCETCGKGFQRKYNLTIHLRVHTGEKPYKCPHCPQAFAQGNDLKAHIRRHTGERFRCEVCGAAFLQGYQIRNHKFMEHGIREDPPTQRVAKFTSPEEQEQQIKQNLQKALCDDIVDSTAELYVSQQQTEAQIVTMTATATTVATETMDELLNI